jgi:hypothetical protein
MTLIAWDFIQYGPNLAPLACEKPGALGPLVGASAILARDAEIFYLALRKRENVTLTSQLELYSLGAASRARQVFG